jgi:AGZA family xanthine/uracil permease-like MFS transporter
VDRVGDPIDAGMAIVLWIGMMIVAQAFDAIPRAHTPRWSSACCPASARGGRCWPRTGLRAAGLGGPAGPFTEALIGEFQKNDTWIAGASRSSRGFPLHRDAACRRRSSA